MPGVRRIAVSALTFLALCMVSGPAVHADIIILTANITHAQEPPPSGLAPTLTSTGAPRPLSFGAATFTLNTTPGQQTLTFSATIFNIDVTGAQTPDTFDNLVAAHIHAAAPPGHRRPRFARRLPG